jgi:putative transposase
MPRINRGLVDSGCYHVINRGNARGDVFLKGPDYEAFQELVRQSKVEFQIKIFAYCLMPNHFHFVVGFPCARKFSKWMQWLMTSHVRRYHKHYGGSGHVWQGRFKSFLIQSDEHLLTVLRYVDANPLRARLADSATAWAWSSCAERVGDTPSDFLNDPPVKLPSNWREWVERSFGESELDAIRRSVNRQTPYGDRAWQKEVVKRLGLESTLRPQGRPRKRGQATF